jgi:ubiquinone/menaquinone biosynthesis C-methylase UbiE
MSFAKYDRIGINYNKHRCADIRIVQKLIELLDIPKESVIADIGAGTGNYTQAIAAIGYHIKAVEPSEVMRSQARSHDLVEWISGTAEHVPLSGGSVDAVICILAAHHFMSLPQAISEMGRISPAGSIVWLTFDPRQIQPPWFADYFPTIWSDAFQMFPPLRELVNLFSVYTQKEVNFATLMVPHDLEDCSLVAGWRRPEMYLDPEVRKCISCFNLVNEEDVSEGLSRLEHDLKSGRWRQLYGSILEEETIDWGYRFLKAI